MSLDPATDPLLVGEIDARRSRQHRLRPWEASYLPPMRDWPSPGFVVEWSCFPSQSRPAGRAFTRAGALRRARRAARVAGYPTAVERRQLHTQPTTRGGITA